VQSQNRGIIVNFAAGTVSGFTYPADDLPVAIFEVDEVHITFGGSNKSGVHFVIGSIDRVTGYTGVSSIRGSSVTKYDLKCRPTQRMF
jgi:hypothetical protein